MRRLGLFLIVYFSFVTGSYSQIKDSVIFSDTGYYVSLRDRLTVYAYGITKFNTFEIKNSEGDYLVRYRPNENFNLGIGFNYQWMGIGGAFNLKFLNDDQEVYGHTKSFDIQSDIFSKGMVLTANLQSYKGFFWDNVRSYDTTWNIRDSVPLRPDVETFNLGVSGIHAFNTNKFSFRAPYVYTEWQKRSAGSWLFGWQFSFYRLSADRYLIPPELAEYYPVLGRLVNLSTMSLGAGFGYSYTLVVKEVFFLNATLLLGLSMQGVTANDNRRAVLINDILPSAHSHFRMAIGVNNERHYYGISLISDTNPITHQEKSEYIYKYGKIKLFYGRHFNVSNISEKRNRKRL